ncbi:MAG: hypothetical protein MHPSP_001477, partial [Paramarteilia canceri]
LEEHRLRSLKKVSEDKTGVPVQLFSPEHALLFNEDNEKEKRKDQTDWEERAGLLRRLGGNCENSQSNNLIHSKFQ